MGVIILQSALRIRRSRVKATRNAATSCDCQYIRRRSPIDNVNDTNDDDATAVAAVVGDNDDDDDDDDCDAIDDTDCSCGDDVNDDGGIPLPNDVVNGSSDTAIGD